MKTNSLLSVLVVLVAALGVAFVAKAASIPSNEEFVKNAAIGGTFEIESSKLALATSKNNDVRTFAQTMIDDHTKAGANLKTAVAKTDVPPATAESPLDEKHQRELDKLKKTAATDFDKAYIKAQVDAHKEAVSLFSKYAKSGKDATLKSFAEATLPTLEKHQEHVKQLDSAS